VRPKGCALVIEYHLDFVQMIRENKIQRKQMTNDAILMQLDYTVTDSALAQVEKVKNNTRGFDYVEKHLITLHDQLKAHLSYVALSSNQDYFKIKNEAKGEEMVKEVNEIIKRWSEKFKIDIEKVDGKNTYYVLGYTK